MHYFCIVTKSCKQWLDYNSLLIQLVVTKVNTSLIMVEDMHNYASMLTRLLLVHRFRTTTITKPPTATADSLLQMWHLCKNRTTMNLVYSLLGSFRINWSGHQEQVGQVAYSIIKYNIFIYPMTQTYVLLLAHDTLLRVPSFINIHAYISK